MKWCACSYLMSLAIPTWQSALMCFQSYCPTVRKYAFKKNIFNKLMLDAFIQVTEEGKILGSGRTQNM